MPVDPTLADEAYCYLTTTGRVTGNPHQIEIWFALVGDTAYLMKGSRTKPAIESDWVRNFLKQPRVTLRIRETTFDATARIVTDPNEDASVRKLLVTKYATPERPLTDWGQTSMPVAIDLDTPAE